MKILMLFPYAPLPPPLDLAGNKRNLPFLLELVKYHEVTVLSYGTAEQERMFTESYGSQCSEVHFIDPGRSRIRNGIERLWLLATVRSPFRQLYRSCMQDAIDETTERKQFDIIHCCVQFFGYFRFPVGIPVTSDTHEVKYDLLHRTAQKSKNLITKVQFYLAYRLGKDEEIKLCRKFDLLTTTTERDRDLFAKDIPAQRIISVQNGAGNSFFEDIGIEPELYSISFTGLFTHVPNTEGIIWFLDEVWPKIVRQEPRAKLYVVGKNPPRKLQARASDNVVITGFVEDVRPYIARSTVFAIPLLAGGGIRGKALEAMAMKRPIVTTGIGVEGIYLVHGKSALFADNPQDFADAVIRLFREPPLREEIARNAFSVVNAHYDWAAKGKELNAVLESVVQSYRKSMGCLIPIDNRVSC